jgi:hypothetical protein
MPLIGKILASRPTRRSSVAALVRGDAIAAPSKFAAQSSHLNF